VRRILGPKRDEVRGELNLLYFSPNIVRVIKSRSTSWLEGMLHVRGKERRVQDFGGETCGKETTSETQA
jgi:hypothetical protein